MDRKGKLIENNRYCDSSFTDENEKLLIQTGEDKYPDVMGKAVNIFSRVGEGCELSFCGFCVE